MYNSLQPHGLQHSRPPDPSSTPRVCSNSCPSSGWCHPTISSSVIPISSCLQSFPASGFFLMSQFFTISCQSIRVSASASVFTMNIQDWFPLGLVGPPCCPWDSQESSPKPQFKRINSLVLSFLYSPTLTFIHDYWKKIIALTRRTFASKVMSLLFNMLSKLGHNFSSKEYTSFNFMAAITICGDFGALKNKDCHCFHCFPIYLPWSDGTRSQCSECRI